MACKAAYFWYDNLAKSFPNKHNLSDQLTSRKWRLAPALVIWCSRRASSWESSLATRGRSSRTFCTDLSNHLAYLGLKVSNSVQIVVGASSPWTTSSLFNLNVFCCSTPWPNMPLYRTKVCSGSVKWVANANILILASYDQWMPNWLPPPDGTIFKWIGIGTVSRANLGFRDNYINPKEILTIERWCTKQAAGTNPNFGRTIM